MQLVEPGCPPPRYISISPWGLVCTAVREPMSLLSARRGRKTELVSALSRAVSALLCRWPCRSPAHHRLQWITIQSWKSTTALGRSSPSSISFARAHRSYDCAINLRPGAPLPSSWLHNLSRPEREAMDRYISQSLASGLVGPSSSSVSAGFFYVKNKNGMCCPCVDYQDLNEITRSSCSSGLRRLRPCSYASRYF